MYYLTEADEKLKNNHNASTVSRTELGVLH